MHASNEIINRPNMLTNAPIYCCTSYQARGQQPPKWLNRYHHLPLAQDTKTASAIGNVFHKTTPALSGTVGIYALNRIYCMSDQPVIVKVLPNKQRYCTQAERWFNIWVSFALMPAENTVEHLASIAKNYSTASKMRWRWLFFVYNAWPTAPTLSDRVHFSGLDPPSGNYLSAA